MDIFHTLAEVAVAITGFASLILIFRSTSTGGWGRQEVIVLGFLLAWSVGAIFLSLLPILAVAFGATLAAAARIGLIVLATFVGLVGVVLSVAQQRAIQREGVSFGGRGRPVAAVFAIALFGCAVGAAAGWLPGATHAWYASLIAGLLAMAT